MQSFALHAPSGLVASVRPLLRRVFPRLEFWLFTAGLCLFNTLWVFISPRLSIAPDYAEALAFCFSLAVIGAALRPWVIGRYGAAGRVAIDAVVFFAFCYTAVDNTRIFNHITAIVDLPLRDAALQTLDHAAGFSWLDYMRLVGSHPVVVSAMTTAYSVMFLVALAVAGLLLVTGRYRDLQEFTALVIVTGILCTLIGDLVPAVGAMQLLGTDDLRAALPPRAGTYFVDELLALRGSGPHAIDTMHMPGVTAYPSYHTVMAVLTVYGARWNLALCAAACCYSAFMIASTPVLGGHYLADVAAGMALAGLAIVAVRSPQVRPLFEPSPGLSA